MVVAPYPHSDAEDENPSIFVSDDGQHWSLPPGGTNPIQKPTPYSHLADFYKSTLAFDSKTDVITVWYSALAGDSWHLGVTQGDLRHTLQELRVPDRRPF